MEFAAVFAKIATFAPFFSSACFTHDATGYFHYCLIPLPLPLAVTLYS